MLYGLFTSIIVIICFLRIVVVLLPPGQQQGLHGGLAAGVMGRSGVGSHRTADLLSTTTSVLAGVFLLLSLLANCAIDAGGRPGSAVQQRGLAPVETDFDAQTESDAPIPVPSQESETPDSEQ